MDDPSRLRRLNPGCPEHGKRGGASLAVPHRYGPGRSKRMPRRRACKARSSERGGTPLLGPRPPAEEALSALRHIAEGNGVRKTGRLLGAHREAVARHGRMAEAHSAGLRDGLVAVSPSDPWGPVRREVGLRRRKEARCDPGVPAGEHNGDRWDHAALDPGHRRVVSVATGKRTAENIGALVRDFHRRTSGRLMDLIATDGYGPPPGGDPGGRWRDDQAIPARQEGAPPQGVQGPARRADLGDAPQDPGRGRVVTAEQRVIFGPAGDVRAARSRSAPIRAANTPFVGRQSGTDRSRNARGVRKSYGFSKDWAVHRAIASFTMYSHNFCWPVRTLRVESEDGTWRRRTPTMAAGLADHVWSLPVWLTLPAVPRK